MTQEAKERAFVIEKPIPSKSMFLEFEIEKEEWNKYVLEDGTLLRLRWILTGALIDKTMKELEKEAKSGQKLTLGFTTRSQNVFAVEAPLELRGPPDQKRYSREELRASIAAEELDFETKRETWNSYLFDNGMRMRARFSPTSVNRTSKFDSGGMPVYLVDSTVGVKLKLPETIERIQEERKRKS